MPAAQRRLVLRLAIMFVVNQSLIFWSEAVRNNMLHMLLE